MSINRVIISGNLTRDPELRSTQSGMDVLSFSVAVNERYKNQQTGEWEDRPNFVDCTVFGKRAASLSQYLAKGTKVSIEGKLRWSQWEKDGKKRSKLDVIVDEIEFMSPRDGQNQAQGYGYPPQPQMAAPAAPQPVYGAQPPLPGYQQQYAAPAPTVAQPVGAFAPAPAATAQVIDASPSVYDDIPFD